MRSHCLSLVVVLVAGSLCASVALAQEYDPRDFSGIWDRNAPNAPLQLSGSRELAGSGGDGAPPPMTALGQERFDATRPGYGPRAVPPATGNDLAGNCNPLGIPRILLYPRPAEFISLDDRLIQVFQWHRVYREIWIDGREIPEDFEPVLRRWLGYSAGRWEGDTLVVDSAGFDDRTWLDHHGYVHSEQMRLEERYTRVAYDTLELEIVVTDPITYTAPWVAEKKSWTLVPREEMSIDGWQGLMEEFCAPVDEVDNFNRRVRDPAGGVIR